MKPQQTKAVSITIEDSLAAIQALLHTHLHSFVVGILVIFVLTATSAFKIRSVQNSANAKKESPSQKSLAPLNVRTYTVQAGDDLWNIAEKTYGSGENAYDIARANGLNEPFTLTENQILILPSTVSKLPSIGDITESAATVRKAKGATYTVKEGDYLWIIAEKVYGDGNMMSKLIEANNIPYPYDVVVGAVLRTP